MENERATTASIAGGQEADQGTAGQWDGHEHTAGQAEIEAQKLVNIAGSVELAKQALDKAIEPGTTTSREQFARQLGFASFLEMFEASTPITDDNGLPWYVTPDPKGQWIAWNERELSVGPHFSTTDDAIASIRPH